MGDTTEPYWAALAEDERSPSVLGERQRIQIPHQHIILKMTNQYENKNPLTRWIQLSKVGRMT